MAVIASEFPTNGTAVEEEPLSLFLVALRTCFVAVVVVVIIGGNALSIAVTRSMPELADSTKVLMISLAMYDMLTGLMSLPNVLASAFDRWPFGELYCSVNGTVDATCCCMSIVLIVGMNAERYIAVTMPFRFPTICARSRVIGFVATASLITIVLQVVMTIFKETEVHAQAVLICDVGFNGWPYEVLVLLCLVILPLVVLTFIYLRLIQLSRSHLAMLSKSRPAAVAGAEEEESGQNRFLDNKALRAFLAVTVLFAICWTPLRVVRIITAVTGRRQADWLLFTAKGFAVSNSFFNVFVYCFFNQSFRRAARRLLATYFGCCDAAVAPQELNTKQNTVTSQRAKRRRGKAAFISVEL